MTPTAAIALALLAVGASALSAVTGVAGGVVLLSGLLLVVPSTAVVPLHGAVQLVAGGARVVGFRRHIRWDIALRFIAGLIPGSLIGLGLVAWVATVSPGLLKGLIAIAILGSLAIRPKRPADAAAPNSDADANADLPPSGLIYGAVGVLCGALGVLVGSTGPIVSQTLLSQGVVKEAHIATKSAVQAFGHLLKIPLFGLALSFDYGAYAIPLALMTVAVIAGTYLGKSLLGRLSSERFVFLSRALLFLLAVHILVSEAAAAFAQS